MKNIQQFERPPDVDITEEDTVLTLDVVNLFTNILIPEVLNILESDVNYYFGDDNKLIEMLQLLKSCLQQISQLYK